MAARPRVLVVDDERAVRTALRVNLTKAGYEVTLASDPREARDLLLQQEFDVTLTDVKMPGGTGMELLETVRAAYPDMQVVVMTGFGSVEDAVKAMKAGAVDYLSKPIEKDELLLVLQKAMDNRALRTEVRQLRKAVGERYGFENLIGRTPVMQRLYDDIATVADTDATVLIEGPTGTGKELLAHALHHRSGRAGGPFVRVNCGAIPATLIESELFGHERGAFTGAIRQHIGKFESANGGTLLLDEIGEIDLSMQVKLLRVLEVGELARVGGTGVIKVDVRIVASTNRDLRAECDAGRFREDLYYRLNVFHINVPPLRDRLEDVPLLVDHFLQKLAPPGTPPTEITPGAMETLRTHQWPGNVRELEHALERAWILARGGPIERIELTNARRPSEPAPAPAPGPGEPVELRPALEDLERRTILEALERNDGVQAAAARDLGISRSNLNYRIQKLGLDPQGR